MPEAVAELVHDCLSEDPEDRPTVDAVVSRTRRALGGGWLPPELLSRLDRDAADFLRTADPTSPLRAADPADVFRVVVRPAHRKQVPVAPPRRTSVAVTVPAVSPTMRKGLRVGRRLLTALLVGAATVAYPWIGPAPVFLRLSDGTREERTFSGVRRVESYGRDEGFSPRLSPRVGVRPEKAQGHENSKIERVEEPGKDGRAVSGRSLPANTFDSSRRRLPQHGGRFLRPGGSSTTALRGGRTCTWEAAREFRSRRLRIGTGYASRRRAPERAIREETPSLR
ncbi:hypothetical protein [Streptomyces sp. NPDC055632]